MLNIGIIKDPNSTISFTLTFPTKKTLKTERPPATIRTINKANLINEQ